MANPSGSRAVAGRGAPPVHGAAVILAVPADSRWKTLDDFLNEARAYAQQLTASAQGEAAAFDKVYEEYRLAPDVTRRRMYYETMERILRNNDKVVVEANGVTPYLPLPEMRRKPAPSETATTGAQ